MNTLVTRSWRAALALVLALSCFAALPVHAQEPNLTDTQPDFSPPAFSFGVRAGMFQNDFHGDAVGSAEARADLTGGAFLTYRFHPNLALQPEVLYARKAGEVNHNGVFPLSRRTEYSLGFVNVPVLLKAYLSEQSGRMFYLTAGPYAGLRVSENADDPNGALENVNLDNELRTWDYGLTTGLGIEGFGGPHAISFDVRYNWGMANLFTEENRPDFRARGFMFTVGVGL